MAKDLKVKKKTEDKIILEEEKEEEKLGLWLFIKRNIKTIYLGLIALSLIIILIVAFTISNFGNTTEPQYKDIELDLTFEDDEDEVQITENTPITTQNPPIVGNAITHPTPSFLEEYGEIGLKDGVIFVVKTFTTDNGTVTYYSDYSSIIVKKDGTIVRASTLNGDYGIDTTGTISSQVVKMKITITKTKTVGDTTITYYSDGSASILKNNHVTYARYSKNIVLDNDDNILYINANKVSFVTSDTTSNGIRVVKYSDGTTKLIKNNITYLVRDNNDYTISGSDLTFPNNNESILINTKTLDNGNIITYYDDGGAILQRGDTFISIRKSNAIILEENKQVKEIVNNTEIVKTKSITTTDGKKINYYNNGIAVVVYTNGIYGEVLENSSIKYNSENNISSLIDTIYPQTSQGILPDNTVVTVFQNDKALIEKADGTTYFVNAKSIAYDVNGYLVYLEDNEQSTPSSKKFTLSNTSDYSLEYKIVLEETTDYTPFSVTRLDPTYINYQMYIGGNYIASTKLDHEVWEVGFPLYGGATLVNKSYVLAGGIIEAKEILNANIALWVDYSTLTNEYQNRAFIGTIKSYVWIDE